MCDCEGGLFQILTKSFGILSLRGETADADEDDDEREGSPEPIMCVHGNVKYMAFQKGQKIHQTPFFC